MYSICMFECLLLIVHFGFIPSDSEINDVSVLTQELVKFLAYFTIFSMLIYDITRLIRSKLIIVVVITIAILQIVIVVIIIKEYVDTSEYTCTSLTFTFIRICHITISIWLVIISYIISKGTLIALKNANKDGKSKILSDIRKLWIITLTSLVESIIHGVIDMSILIANPNDWYKITTSYPFDAILWFALRFFEVNFWIWPTIYAFNSRDIVKYQNSRGGRLMSDLTDLEETSIGNLILIKTNFLVI